MTLEVEYQGPKRGADRAVLLAHGAGADMHAAALTTRRRRAAPTPRSRRCGSTSRTRPPGGAAPDRPPVLEAAVREAAAELAARAKLPPERIVLGGRSMGGRIGSLVVADATIRSRRSGSCCSATRCTRRASPSTLRVEHFPRIRVPCLFVSGTRDAFGSPTSCGEHVRRIKGTVAWHWIETADHGFKPLKASGLSAAAALEAAAAAVVAFVRPAELGPDVPSSGARFRPGGGTWENGAVRVDRWFAFVDLAGFTSFGDEHGDDESVRVLTVFRAVVRSVATDYGVRIAKWLGDGCMLVSVVPEQLVAARVHARTHGRRGRATAADPRGHGRRRGDPARRRRLHRRVREPRVPPHGRGRPARDLRPARARASTRRPGTPVEPVGMLTVAGLPPARRGRARSGAASRAGSPFCLRARPYPRPPWRRSSSRVSTATSRWLRLNRPRSSTASRSQMWHEMRTLGREIGDDPTIRALVVIGNGRAFSSGHRHERVHRRRVADDVLRERRARHPRRPVGRRDPARAGVLHLARRRAVPDDRGSARLRARRRPATRARVRHPRVRARHRGRACSSTSTASFPTSAARSACRGSSVRGRRRR